MVQCIEELYKNASSEVLLGGHPGDYFRTTTGVRQGILLSPVLFNLFLTVLTRETLPHFETLFSIGGRLMYILQFTYLIAGSNEELHDLTDILK